MTEEEDLRRYKAVNGTNTLKELADVIVSFADDEGFIQGKTRKFDARKMAKCAELLPIVPLNTLTRNWGIRQQAFDIFKEQ